MKFKKIIENTIQNDTLFANSKLCEDMLIEDKSVKFEGQVNPAFGWCVIMCGGSGVGKSTAFDYLVPINARKYDVDELKQYTLKTSELDGNKLILKNGEEIDLNGIKEPYTLSNPAFNNLIHQKTAPLAKKVKQNILGMGANTSPERLPNIVFDITGSNIDDFQSIIITIKPLGYKIAIVWVLGEIERAIEQNKARDREVPLDTLIYKHNNSFNTITHIFSDKEMLHNINEFWIILQTIFNPKDKVDTQRYINLPNVYKINSKEDVINLPNRIQGMINRQRKVITQKMLDVNYPRLKSEASIK